MEEVRRVTVAPEQTKTVAVDGSGKQISGSLCVVGLVMKRLPGDSKASSRSLRE